MLRARGKGGRQDAGFTLVEMMVAALILILLLAVGAPGFQVFLQNMQIRSAAESMQAGLVLARGEAVRRNAWVSLWMVDSLKIYCLHNSNGKAWVVSQDDPAGRCDQAASNDAAPRLIQSGRVNDGSTNVRVDGLALPVGGSPAEAADCITFNSVGRVEEQCHQQKPLARIRFESAVAPASTRALELRVAPGGAVQLCDPAAPVGARAAC
jgi:type IV fimbrial biogenesis protein FimT